jgi:hypothetical protein
MAPNVIPFKMHTIDDVHESIPQDLRPTKPKFKELVEKHGLYRDLCGKQFMLESDVDQLFEIIRATPKAADVKRGAARLIAETPAPNEMGYLAVFGDRLDKDAPIFIGWAPRDGQGVTDLKNLVRLGYPGTIATLGFCAATPEEVDSVRGRLSKACVGNKGWYARSDDVIELLMDLRKQGIDDLDDDETEDDTRRVVNMKGEL